MMVGYLFKTWCARPLWVMLNIIGIALAVAIYISIQCVNKSAERAFAASVEAVAGKADTEIVSRSGMLSEDNFLYVRQHPDIKAATPVLEKIATLVDSKGEYLKVIGVDFFSNAEFANFSPDKITAEDQKTGTEFLTDPEGILISDRFARRLNLKKGDEIRLQTSIGIKKAKIVGFFELREEYIGADEYIALMDIGHAQDFFNHVGELSRIDIIRHEGISMDTLRASLQPYITPEALIQAPQRRSERLVNMTQAFRLNLVALSLVALLLCVFLIYNTMTANVARRYYDIGIWRALGASRGKVRLGFILEAVFLAVIGSAFGLLLGYLLAQFLVEQASQTISALYGTVNIHKVFFPEEQAIVAFILAMAAAVVGAWLPAKQASEVDPIAALQPANIQLAASQHLPTWTALGLLFLGGALECARQSERLGPAWLSFGAALFLLLGVSFLSPIIFWILVKIAKLWPGTFWRLAMSQFEMAFTRNTILASSILCAVAMVIGILIMITGFRDTVNQWLQQTVRADLYVAPISSSTVGAQEVLPEAVLEKLREIVPPERIDTYREIPIEYQGTPARLSSIQFNVAAEYARIRFIDSDKRLVTRPELLKESADKGWIIVSESFSRRHDVHARHRIRLMTNSGEKIFRVAGVFQDYTTEAGLILVDFKTYQKYWKDKQVNSVALYLSKEQSVDELKKTIKEQIKDYGAFIIYSNRDLRRQVLKIFDQTFAITSVLQSVTMVICAIGIYLNILVHGMERSRVIASLRAQGASRWQVQRVYGWEALFLGTIAVVLGIAGGYALSWVLTNVINVAFFGWTINMSVPKKEIVLLGAAVLMILCAAAWLASWKLEKQSIATAIRSD